MNLNSASVLRLLHLLVLHEGADHEERLQHEGVDGVAVCSPETKQFDADEIPSVNFTARGHVLFRFFLNQSLLQGQKCHIFKEGLDMQPPLFGLCVKF